MPRLSFRRVVIGLVVAAVAVVANPTWAAAIGLDVWNLPKLQEDMAASSEKERELDHAAGEVLRRVELKHQLVADLIDGRTTLAEVNSHFLALNRPHKSYMLVIRASCEGRTDEERMARNILSYVSRELSLLPQTSRDEVTSRLDAEFANLVASADAE